MFGAGVENWICIECSNYHTTILKDETEECSSVKKVRCQIIYEVVKAKDRCSTFVGGQNQISTNVVWSIHIEEPSTRQPDPYRGKVEVHSSTQRI